MARSVTTDELALLASIGYTVLTKVEIQDGDLAYRDYRSQGGYAWIVGGVIDHDIDQPVAQATVQLWRQQGHASGPLSLSPLREDSTLNRLSDGTTYAPAIDVGRRMKIATACVAIGATPSGGDWKPMFEGTIDTFQFEGPVMTVVARDDGGVLVDAYFGTPRTFTFTEVTAEDIDVVAQEILDDLSEGGIITDPITLDVPTRPAFVITSFKYELESAMDVLQRLVQVIGWDLRYRWKEAAGAFRLRLTDPGRNKTTPDRTLAASQIIKVAEMKIDRTNVRNLVEVYYGTTGPGGARQLSQPASDAQSIAKYGLRRMTLQESSDSAINTADEALAMAQYAVADLKDPRATHTIELFYDWTIELHDLLRAAANNNQYDTAQDYAVVSVKHTFTGGDQPTARTLVQTRGAPAGAFRTWIARSRTAAPPPSNTGTDAALNDFSHTDAADGTTRTFTWTRGERVRVVFVYDRLEQAPPTVDPWPTDDQFPTTILRAGTDSYTATKPPAGFQRFVQFEPRVNTFDEGTVRRAIIDPAAPALSAKITAVVTNATADLTVVVAAGVSDWPVTVEVLEGAGDTLIASTTLSADATLSKLTAGLSALGGRALPLRELLGWRVRLTNVAGQVAYAFTSADRDALPNGAVTLVDYRANPKFVCSYDDDTDEIKITFANGATKTLTIANGGLTAGGGTVTVAIGDSVTSGSPESAFLVDEVRTGYKVEYKGGGQYVTIWGGPTSALHGQPSNPPTVKPRVVLSANRDAADVYVTVSTSVSEKVRLYVRDAEDGAAPIYGLCVGAGDSTALNVDAGTEVGPSNFFSSGGSPVAKLSGITLTRDQVKRIYVQAIGKDSGVASAWVPVTLSLKEQPWLESIAATWDEASGQLRVRVKGGANCASVFVEASSASNFSAPSTLSNTLADGDDVTLPFALSGAQRGKTWYVRATPFNATGLGGLSGVAQVDEVAVPASFTVNPAATENSSAGTGTLTLSVVDAGAVIDGTNRIKFYVTVNGARTLNAATSAPAGTATTGDFVYTVTLDPKHNVKVEPIVYYADGSTAILGAWTFDSDKLANVLSAVPAIDNQTAKINCTFDTDTVVGAATARYRVNAGSWTTFAVAAALTGSFTVTLSATALQTIDVQAQDADGNWGPSLAIQLGTYDAPPPNGTISIDPISGNTAAQASVSVRVDLPANTQSVYYKLVTGPSAAQPSDATVIATGTLVNITNVLSLITATTINLGDLVEFVAVPFTGTGWTGSQLRAIHIRSAYTSFGKTTTLAWYRTAWQESTAAPDYTLDANENIQNPATGSSVIRRRFRIPVGHLVPGVKLSSATFNVSWNTATNPLGSIATGVDARSGTNVNFTNAWTYGGGAQSLTITLGNYLVAAGDYINLFTNFLNSVGAAADGAQAYTSDCSLTYVTPTQDKGP